MPPKRARDRAELKIELKATTPIYGGAPVPREIDSVDVIRPASIRGQLRFWWRALFAQDYANSQELYIAESRLWGGPTVKDVLDIGRSPVEIRVDLRRSTEVRREVFPGPKGYALFPSRAQKDGTPTAQIRMQDMMFDLRLSFPSGHEQSIRDALRAWVLFGGYGGRTRRGLGSLTVTGEATSWLPTAPSYLAIKELFGRDVFAQPSAAAGVTPLLAGARLFIPFQTINASEAWSQAMGWLQEFRQGSNSRSGARRPGADDRPSISNWPEADKVRHFSKADLPWAHPPDRHNDLPAWPRAGFGLPIMGQFQSKNRDKMYWEQEHPPKTEPREFRIGWQQHGKPRDRLASPLILKPLALLSSGGKENFSPIALWLNRAYPDGEVILQRSNGKVVPGSEVLFTQFLAPGDEVYFDALRGKATLEDAFFAWLEVHGRPQRSTPRGDSKRKKRGRR